MNASGEREEGTVPSPHLHRACLSLGSNIQPEEYIPRAVNLLKQYTQIMALSQCWQTPAVGSDGPDFINMAVSLLTGLDAEALKTELIASIENRLGRIRTADKNAPRTIDLDIVLFDGAVLDHHLWQRLYLALPVSELFPDLPHPLTGQRLEQVAQELFKETLVLARPEFLK